MAKIKKKILLVDDDEIHLSSARTMLEDVYEVIIAKSGNEALECFLQRRIPDLVLLDILMPDMDGWEIFNRLKALSFLQDIPIAFFTSITETSDLEHAHRIGAADFITKPFEKKDLLKRIKKILIKRQ